MKKLILLLSLVLWALPGDPAAADGEFILVVNAANPTTELERDRISKMFLKKVKRWDDDEAVVAVDQPEKSTVREKFTREIHKKSVSAIKSYWQRMIFSGRDVGPPELTTDADVLEFVRNERGAIGYVSGDAELGTGVKKLVAVEKRE